MGYASKAGRARTDASNPQAHAICDRCGFRYNHVNLRWQFDWRGASLMNIRLLVCDTCYDAPQEQLRAIVVPADPVPIEQPRLQDFVTASQDTRVTSVRTRSITRLASRLLMVIIVLHRMTIFASLNKLVNHQAVLTPNRGLIPTLPVTMTLVCLMVTLPFQRQVR